MESKNMIGTIVTLAVVVICVATIMMPVLSDATKTTDTFTNEGYFDMKYSETDDITLVWTYSDPDQVTVNGEVVSLEAAAGKAVTIITGDDWFLRYNGGSAVAIDSATNSTFGANVASAQTMTLVATGGTVTATVSADGATDSSKTYAYTYLYTIDADGEYVMKLPTEAAYLNADSQIYAAGGTVLFTSVYTLIKTSGSYEDGLTATVFKPTSGYTATDVTPNFKEVSSHIDLYTLDSFVITVSNGSTTETATYSYFLVPAEVTAERAVHFTDGENALINAIPAIVITVLVVAAVGMLVVRNRD